MSEQETVLLNRDETGELEIASWLDSTPPSSLRPVDSSAHYYNLTTPEQISKYYHTTIGIKLDTLSSEPGRSLPGDPIWYDAPSVVKSTRINLSFLANETTELAIDDVSFATLINRFHLLVGSETIPAVYEQAIEASLGKLAKYPFVGLELIHRHLIKGWRPTEAEEKMLASWIDTLPVPDRQISLAVRSFLDRARLVETSDELSLVNFQEQLLSQDSQQNNRKRKTTARFAGRILSRLHLGHTHMHCEHYTLN